MKTPSTSPPCEQQDWMALRREVNISSSERSCPRNACWALCPFSAFHGCRLTKQISSSSANVSQQSGIRHSWKRKRPELLTWWALWLPILFLAHRHPAAGDEGNSPLLSNATLALVANFQPSVIRYHNQPSPASVSRRKLLQNSTPTRRPPSATPIALKSPTGFPTRHPFKPPSFPPTRNPLRAPSLLPSDVPSSSPSLSPSQYPSFLPTYSENLTTFSRFTQQFGIGKTSVFNAEEILKFESLFESYTYTFGDSELVATHKINTTCIIIKQTLQHPIRRGLRDLRSLAGPVVQDRIRLATSNTSSNAINTVQYSITFNSFVRNITDYPDLFRNYVTQNVFTVVLDLRGLGLNVTSSQPPLQVVVTPSPTFSPTFTRRPSPAPSLLPSGSSRPSNDPTSAPSHNPTINTNPTAIPTVRTEHPSSTPSMAPSRPIPHNTNDTATVVGVAVAGGIALILIALFIFYYLRRKRLRESASQAVPINGSGRQRTPSRLEITRVTSWRPSSHVRTPSTSLTHPITTDSRTTVPYPGNASGATGPGLISPSDSMASHQSLISVGNSVGPDSGEDEPDATQNLADEFDKYKDQNLEKMRADVEGNLSGFDGMMSQALTKALMEDDELNSDPKELLWGGHGKQTGIEIEASALCDVNDWLKRMENATMDESRGFMQEILNKMVASVRHGVLGPKEASRAVHECAALLGLQLASEIPGATLIVSGLRKTSTAEDVIEAFRTFGEIEEAAVASNQRGFAVVRYLSAKSVDRALHEYRTGEIVVQDVAVQVRVLKSEVGSLPGPSDLASPAPVVAGTPEMNDRLP